MDVPIVILLGNVQLNKRNESFASAVIHCGMLMFVIILARFLIVITIYARFFHEKFRVRSNGSQYPLIVIRTRMYVLHSAEITDIISMLMNIHELRGNTCAVSRFVCTVGTDNVNILKLNNLQSGKYCSNK